jgi:hypothetical protein
MPRVGKKLNKAKNLIKKGHFHRKAKVEKYIPSLRNYYQRGRRKDYLK